jgi:hypothetical protein
LRARSQSARRSRGAGSASIPGWIRERARPAGGGAIRLLDRRNVARAPTRSAELLAEPPWRLADWLGEFFQALAGETESYGVAARRAALVSPTTLAAIRGITPKNALHVRINESGSVSALLGEWFPPRAVYGSYLAETKK